MRTFLSWSSACHQIKKWLSTKSVNTASFTFFGGLIELGVHRQAARRRTVINLARRLGQDETTVNAALESAWSLSAAIYVSKGLDWEPPVRVVFDRWIRLLNGDAQSNQEIADLAEVLVEDEIEFLATHAKVNETLIAAIASVNRNVTHTMIIDDTSFSARDLRSLSQKAGVPDLIETWVTSADQGLRKHTGRLFGALERKPALHIGTDVVSDGMRPAEFGIRPWVIYDWNSQYSRHKMGIDKIWWPLESAGFEPSAKSTTSAMIRTLHRHPHAEVLKSKLKSLAGK
jgi:hypothetical protein